MTRLLFFVCLLFTCACRENTYAPTKVAVKSENVSEPAVKSEWQKIHQSLDSLHPMLPGYLKKFRLNEQFVLVAHLGLHSGLPRLVLWNLATQKIIDSGLVAHGNNRQEFAVKAEFSNEPGSYCSSLGRYRIGYKYEGNFGLSYKLHGLDETNSNAFKRYVVLHPYTCVPESTVYPDYCCNSLGCPMISPGYLSRLAKLIDGSLKPLLLWVIK